MNRRRFLGLAAVGATGAAALGSVVSRSGVVGEKSEDVIAVGRRGWNGSFPNVLLRTHENAEVRFYDDLLKGRTVLVNFLSASCGDDCSQTTANLKRVQEILGERVGRDIFMYSISLDPEHDTPEVLARYARHHEVHPGWQFLTGERPDINVLLRTFGFAESIPTAVAGAHGESHVATEHHAMVWYGIEPLQRWGGCPSMTNPKWLARYLLWMEPNGERPSIDTWA